LELWCEDEDICCCITAEDKGFPTAERSLLAIEDDCKTGTNPFGCLD